MKEVVVDGFSYAFSVPAVSATVTMVGLPSVKCKAGGKGICKDGFSVSVSAISTPAGPIPDAGPYVVSFTSSAVKTKADGTLVLLKGDKTGVIDATPTITNPSPPPDTLDVPVSFYIEITGAGQTKVKGN